MATSTTGTLTNSSNLMYRSFKPILKGAGLPQIRFHDLRHTCATIRFMKGQHPKRVQEFLGHASIAMTMDIYSHVIPGMGDDNSIMDDLQWATAYVLLTPRYAEARTPHT
jgi:integrase